MNSGQTAAATVGGAVLARKPHRRHRHWHAWDCLWHSCCSYCRCCDGTATALKFIEERSEATPKYEPYKGSDFKNYYLEKDGTLYQFCIRKTADWGYYHVKAPNQPWSKRYYYHFDLDKLRTAYAVCLRDSYVRIN